MAAGSSPKRYPFHLSAPDRVAFCPKLRLYREVGSHAQRDVILTSESVSRLERIASSARDIAQSEPAGNTVVDSSVKRVLAELELSAATVSNEKELFPIVSAAVARAGDFACETCAGSKDEICRDDHYHDHRNLTLYGHCIAPLRELFSFVAQSSWAYYRHFSSVGKEEPMPEVRLGTQFDPDPLSGLVVEPKIYATGLTDLSPLGTDAVVSAIIDVEKFDWPSFAALAYILFHEFICHAWQGLRAGDLRVDGREHGQSQPDAFAEGWMDHVALEFVAIPILSGRSQVPGLPQPQTYCDEQRDQGRNLHLARLRKRAQYRYGRSIAEKFWRELLLRTESEERANRLFLRASFEFTLMRRSDTKTFRPFDNLARYLSADIHTLAQLERFSTALRSFLLHENVLELGQMLERIP